MFTQFRQVVDTRKQPAQDGEKEGRGRGCKTPNPIRLSVGPFSYGLLGDSLLTRNRILNRGTIFPAVYYTKNHTVGRGEGGCIPSACLPRIV